MAQRARSIAIVGASVAGLRAAARLAAAGCDVTVFERANAIDPMPRTLIVTNRFRRILGEDAEPCIRAEVERFELFAGTASVTVALGDRDLIIERAQLVWTLLDRARANGAKITLGHRFLGFSHDGSLLFAGREANGERVTADAVIGADGAFSRVARAAGWPQQPTVPLVQALVRLPATCGTTTSQVWFRPDDSPYFFWLVPESPTTGALGLIGEDGPATRAALDRFLAKQRIETLAYQAARISMYRRWIPVHRRVANTDVYLAGDAAGQVKVSTVGGIVTGIRGADGVVDRILDGSTRELRSLRRELDVHLLVRRALHGYRVEDYQRLLAVVDRAARRSLTIHDRDQARRMVLRLAMTSPRLLALGARALIGRSAFQTHASPSEPRQALPPQPSTNGPVRQEVLAGDPRP